MGTYKRVHSYKPSGTLIYLLTKEYTLTNGAGHLLTCLQKSTLLQTERDTYLLTYKRVHSYKRSGTLTYLLTKGERNLLSAGLRWHLVTLYGSAGSAVREQFIAQTLVKPNIFNEMFVKPLKKQKKNNSNGEPG